MPKAKPGQSRKGKNKALKTTTQRGQSSSTGLSAEAEQASIDNFCSVLNVALLFANYDITD